MSGKLVSDSQIIHMTAKAIRCFYNHEDLSASVPLEERFLWLDPEREDAMCVRPGMSPAILSGEEYRMVLHERNIWVVYGSYSVTVPLEDASMRSVQMRGTFVWRRQAGEIRLLHAHTSPEPGSAAVEAAQQPAQAKDSQLMEYVRRMEILHSESEKIMFREDRRRRRYLYPDEVLYIEAAQQRVVVHTKTESFGATRLIADYEQSLPEYFKRIHKSYLVNTDYIMNVSCKEVTLQDGQKLPIGRNRSGELKKYLIGAKRSAGRVHKAT